MATSDGSRPPGPRGHIRAGAGEISGPSPRRFALKGSTRSFQIVRLFNNLTVVENIETAALAHGHGLRQARRIAGKLLEAFGLRAHADDLGGGLSYGDKRRVEIARALAADPKFLLLDEPAAGMNEAETETLLHTLSELPRASGLGLLIIDHDMGLIMRLCQRLHVLASGRTIATGSADEVRRDPAVIDVSLGSEAPPACARTRVAQGQGVSERS